MGGCEERVCVGGTSCRRPWWAWGCAPRLSPRSLSERRLRGPSGRPDSCQKVGSLGSDAEVRVGSRQLCVGRGASPPPLSVFLGFLLAEVFLHTLLLGLAVFGLRKGVGALRCRLGVHRGRGGCGTRGVAAPQLLIGVLGLVSFFFSFFFFVFLGPHPRHMEVPRLGVKSEL